MTALVLLNGGIGKRIGADVPKQFIRLDNIPTFIYSLRIADELDAIEHVVMNYPVGWKKRIQELVQKYAISTPITYVAAGKNRQDSVYKLIQHTDSDSIILHEAARPLISAKDFTSILDHPEQNVTYALPLSFTVLEKTAENFVGTVLERDPLINIQLPQKFCSRTLKAAHDQAKKSGKFYTEDAALVHEYGARVKTIHGMERNIKITTPLDINIATYLLGYTRSDRLDA